jgi:regulator of replication initiation timing
MRSLLLSVLLLLAVSLFFCYGLKAQDSALILPMSSPLWESLLPATSSLPAQIRAYRDTWMKQLAGLQTNNDDLLTSNASLRLDNEGLQASLQASQADLATSKSAQQQLQTALDDSTRSTIRAQSDARALKAQNTLLKWSGGILLLAGGVYFGGHALGAW